jgi:hypothetical protein
MNAEAAKEKLKDGDRIVPDITEDHNGERRL